MKKKMVLFLLFLCADSFGFGFSPAYDCEEDFYSARILLKKIPKDVKIIDVYSVLSDFEKFNLFFDPKGSDLQFVPADGWIVRERWDFSPDTTHYQYKKITMFLDRISSGMKRFGGNLLEGRSRSEYFKNYPDVIFKSGDRTVRFRFNKVNYYNIFFPYYIKIKNYFKYGSINPPILEKNRDTCTSPRNNIFLYDFVDE